MMSAATAAARCERSNHEWRPLLTPDASFRYPRAIRAKQDSDTLQAYWSTPDSVQFFLEVSMRIINNADMVRPRPFKLHTALLSSCFSATHSRFREIRQDLA